MKENYTAWRQANLFEIRYNLPLSHCYEYPASRGYIFAGYSQFKRQTFYVPELDSYVGRPIWYNFDS